MQGKISYEMILACKMGDQDALKAILKYYEPLIIEASKRITTTPEGEKLVTVDPDLKAYIESELSMKILLKYDLTRKPRRNHS